VLGLAIVGFPVAIALAWVFDITPDGVERTPSSNMPASPVSTEAPPAHSPPADVAQPRAAGRAQPLSIAVLPFVNMSADPDNEYFSDGLSEEMLNLLAQVPALRVAARTSSFAFKGKDTSIVDIAGRLRVANVLEGSVRRSGDRVRITAQLIAAEDGYHLWSQTYDRELRDVFEVQDEIARAIVESLRVRLDTDGLTPARATNSDAHALYLKGRFLAARSTREDFERSIELFGQALELDADYAPAHAGIAFSYGFLADVHMPGVEALPLIVAAARRALELDPELADAHAVLGMALSQWGWEWPDASRSLRRAIELNPSHAFAHMFHATCSLAVGDRDQALQSIRKAHRLDPLSAIISYFVEVVEGWVGDPDAVITQHRVTEELAPGFAYLDSPVGDAYRIKGMHDDAVAAYRHAERVLGVPSAGLASLYAETGRTTEAEQGLADLEQCAAQGAHVVPEFIARVHLALGRQDQALDWLGRGVHERSAVAPMVATWPVFEPLFAHPRMHQLRQRIGLDMPMARARV
jgi:serine/threonine-protein kinase